MRSRWRTVLLFLLVAEVLIGATIVRIQPRCEPCLPGQPCEPCISDDQRRLLLLGGALPAGVVLVQLVAARRTRSRP